MRVAADAGARRRVAERAHRLVVRLERRLRIARHGHAVEVLDALSRALHVGAAGGEERLGSSRKDARGVGRRGRHPGNISYSAAHARPVARCAEVPRARDGDWIFFDNAGGSQILGSAAARVAEFYATSNVQLGGSYALSQLAGARVADGVQRARPLARLRSVGGRARHLDDAAARQPRAGDGGRARARRRARRHRRRSRVQHRLLAAAGRGARRRRQGVARRARDADAAARRSRRAHERQDAPGRVHARVEPRRQRARRRRHHALRARARRRASASTASPTRRIAGSTCAAGTSTTTSSASTRPTARTWRASTASASAWPRSPASTTSSSNDAPYKLQPGHVPYELTHALPAVVEYLESLDFDDVAEHERGLRRLPPRLPRRRARRARARRAPRLGDAAADHQLHRRRRRRRRDRARRRSRSTSASRAATSTRAGSSIASASARAAASCACRWCTTTRMHEVQRLCAVLEPILTAARAG